MAQDYEKRLSIPITGDALTELHTKSGVQVCKGYERIVIGARGPYVELSDEQLCATCLSSVDTPHYYYEEFRIEPDNVKVYHQRVTVTYADYRPGLYYISPFDLYDAAGAVLIEPVVRQKK